MLIYLGALTFICILGLFVIPKELDSTSLIYVVVRVACFTFLAATCLQFMRMIILGG